MASVEREPIMGSGAIPQWDPGANRLVSPQEADSIFVF